MSVRKLYSDNKIFFPNPKVIRVEYDDEFTELQAETAYRRLKRQTYKLVNGTWGHSALIYYLSKDTSDLTPVLGLPRPALIGDRIILRHYGYLCFKDELDVLQLRLSVSESLKQLTMWPSSLRFTIHELVSDES